MTASLRAFASIIPLDIAQDGECATLGFLSDPKPWMLTFVESSKALKAVRRAPRPLLVITTAELAPSLPPLDGVAHSPQPRRSFIDLHNRLTRDTDFYGAHLPTAIDATATIHPTATIGPVDIQIGPRAVVGPHVTISGRCRIGSDVVLHAGVVLGAEGFQTSRIADEMIDMAHAGGLRIDDGVVVHANAVVARGVFHDETVIGTGSRIGNLAFVSHNTQIGARCFIGHGAVVNGFAVVEDGAWVGPGSTVSNRLRLGAGARVSLGAVVIADVPEGQQVTGNVAVEHRKHLRGIARMERGRS